MGRYGALVTQYNGWTNYETWLINLWADNDAGSYEFWREQAQETYNEASADDTFSRDERAALDLAEKLKEWHNEATPEVTGLWADMINAALSEVNWYEIAEHYISDCDKEIADADSDEV